MKTERIILALAVLNMAFLLFEALFNALSDVIALL